MKTITTGDSVEAQLHDVLEVHFDPERGAPYWLTRARELGFDPRAEIKCVADLPRLGMMDPKDLASRSLEEFLPRPLLDRRSELIIGQTGGTLGRPAWTAYLETEFHQAFVDPFLAAAEHLGFPAGGSWLYAGPSGPHIIARAADAIARSSGAMPNFLPAPAAARYLSRLGEPATGTGGSGTTTALRPDGRVATTAPNAPSKHGTALHSSATEN